MSKAKIHPYNVDLSRVDVESFLNELGVRNVEDKGLEIFYSCPFPGHNHEDQNPSASMNVESTVAYCFSCGWRGNALTFLSDFENVSPIIAARWLRERFGDDFLEPEGKFLDEVDTILAGTKKREDTVIGAIDEYEATRRKIDWMTEGERYFRDGLDVSLPVEYMFKRKFSNWVLDRFDIGYDPISQRIVIPYRNEKGQLVGFKGRAVSPETLPRYWVLGGHEYGFESFNVGGLLFGLNLAIKTPEYLSRNELNVVEGELNCLAMIDKGFPNTVGVSGKFVSDHQRLLLVKYCNNVTFIFDELIDSLKAADKLLPNLNVKVAPEHDKDPADMTKEELTQLMIKTISPIKLFLDVIQ